MFDQIDGLPVHPLVVHGVVVLLPLAAIATIAIALRPAWRLRYGWLVLGVTAVATALIPVATASGEALQQWRGRPEEHADLGGTLIWFALPLLVLVAAMVLLEHRSRAGDGSGGRALPRAVAAVAVLVALATTAQVYRVGDSGAEAVWGDVVPATSPDR